MAPKAFGKYEVLARLATGGAANIFLARQPGAAGFHKLVCLKTLLPERASDADFVAMFLDEARLAARLNHPNCVQIYDLGRVRGSYYISMEYIFGETLWNLLATVTKLRTPLPAPHVASIIACVCDGLHHAHELKDSNGRPYNLVHRDVSPQNVMVTFEGQTKVVDFGIAKAETGRAPTIAGIVKGKFSYMSPEQITGGAIDRRSDVYSLGIVLFECLASRRLYRGDSPEDIARLILEHRAPRLKDVVPDIPAALDTICATALSRHPSKRYQTAHAMGEALRDYLDGVRYNHSAAAIAKLVEERFKGQIPARRKVFESALAGTYDEKHLLEVLDARPARDIDLFPDEDEAEGLPPNSDFIEPSSAIEVSSGVPSEDVSPLSETIDGDDPATGDLVETGLQDVVPEPSVREARGWRIELEDSDVARPPVSVLTDTDWPKEANAYDDATRVDGGDPDGATNFEVKEGDNTRIDLNAEEDDEFGDKTELPMKLPVDGPTNVELNAQVGASFSDGPFSDMPFSEVSFASVPFSSAAAEMPFIGEETFETEGLEEKTYLDATDQLEVETGELPVGVLADRGVSSADVAVVATKSGPTKPNPIAPKSGLSSFPAAVLPRDTTPRDPHAAPDATPLPVKGQRRTSSVARLSEVSVGAAQSRAGPMITRSPNQPNAGHSGVAIPATSTAATGVASAAKTPVPQIPPTSTSPQLEWTGVTRPTNNFGEATEIEGAGAGPDKRAPVTGTGMPTPALVEPSTLTSRLAAEAEAAMAVGRGGSSTDPELSRFGSPSQLSRMGEEMVPRDTTIDRSNGADFTPPPGVKGEFTNTATAPAGSNITPVPHASAPRLEAAPAAAKSPARFGLAAVIAALGFGIALGIIIGLLIARAAYSTVTIPVTPAPAPSPSGDRAH